MKAEVARDDLVRLFGECAKVGKLAIAQVRTEHDEIVASAGNMGLSYVGCAPASGDDLSFFVEPKDLSLFLAACKGDFARLTIRGETLSVKCGTASAKFPLSDGDRMLEPEMRGNKLAISDPSVFDVLYAVSRDINNPHLGVLSLSQRQATATDGHRIATVPCECEFDLSIPYYLASKAATCIKQAEVQVSNFGNACLLSWRNDLWSQQLPEQVFPDVPALIASNQPKDPGVKMDCEDLASAIGTVLLLADNSQISLELIGENLVVSSVGGSSEAEASVPCDGDAFPVASCNGRYLSQALKGYKTVTLSQKDNLSPIFAEFTDDVGMVALAVIMPMRLDNA